MTIVVKGNIFNNSITNFNIRIKKLMKMGAKRFGIHAFLASNMIEKDYYPTLAGKLFEEAVRLNKETGAKISFVNLSGGIGIPYKPEDEPADIAYIGKGVEKAYNETRKPNTKVVVLIPARTDTSYWHKWIFPHATHIDFVRGRIKFGNSKNSAPFPSAVVEFQNTDY